MRKNHDRDADKPTARSLEEHATSTAAQLRAPRSNSMQRDVSTLSEHQGATVKKPPELERKMID